MEEKEFYFFWEFIIFTTVFNILARILNRCNFYLIGAFGFIILSLTQCICFIFFIKNSINDFSNQSENGKLLQNKK
uniref:Uncharacterized protein n=1 Tax=Panagrolaimus superbus TaxID=310955 RepID=A0A914XST1_9BILA